MNTPKYIQVTPTIYQTVEDYEANHQYDEARNNEQTIDQPDTQDFNNTDNVY